MARKGTMMKTVISYFAGLDKTTVKQFVTVVGVIGFFALAVSIIPLVAFGQQETAANVLIAMLAVAGVTGVVGREYFMAV
jgi:hypothetical protein